MDSSVALGRTGSKKTYYDIIAGLAAFEKSQAVSLTPEELLELTTISNNTKEEKKKEDHSETEIKPDNSIGEKKVEDTEAEEDKPKINIHGYLGGKVDLSEATNVNYDLGHTLLGGYVPKKQLESLSSLDFAHYFHKSLECEDALQIYDLFIPTSNKMHMLLNTNGNDTSKITPDRITPEGKIIRKVIICKKCKSKFYGPTRLQQLKKHDCN